MSRILMYRFFHLAALARSATRRIVRTNPPLLMAQLDLLVSVLVLAEVHIIHIPPLD